MVKLLGSCWVSLGTQCSRVRLDNGAVIVTAEALLLVEDGHPLFSLSLTLLLLRSLLTISPWSCDQADKNVTSDEVPGIWGDSS